MATNPKIATVALAIALVAAGPGRAGRRKPVRPLTIEALQDRQRQQDVAGRRCGMPKICDALKRLNKHLDKNPDDLRNRIRRGRILALGGNFDHAMADFNWVLFARPNHPEARQSRGALLFILKEYDLAMRDFLEASASKQNDPLLEKYVRMCHEALWQDCWKNQAPARCQVPCPLCHHEPCGCAHPGHPRRLLGVPPGPHAYPQCAHD